MKRTTTILTKNNSKGLKANVAKLMLLLVLIFGIQGISAQTKTWNGSSNNNWNTAANWTPSGVPASTDDVLIPDDKTVTVNTAAVCKSFTMGSGNNDITVTISGTNSLTVSEGIDIDNGTGIGDDRFLIVGTGTLSCASILIQETGNNNRDSRITVSTGTVNVTGDVTMEGNGTRNLFIFSGAGTYNIGGTMSGGSFTASSSTVNYNGSGSQTIGTYTYNNLTTSTSGVKTLPTGSVVNGTVRIQDTTTLESGATNLVGTGAFQLNGGTFSTGATIGFSDTVGILTLLDDSNIALGTGNHTLTFAASNGATWTSGKMLTITGWVGGYNGTAASGTNPKIFVGNNANRLTATQLSQIRFFDGTNYYNATLLTTGQLVPTNTTRINTFPASACANSTIEITGSGFTGATAVRVNGLNVASYTVNSSTSITAILAATQTSGTLTIVTPSGTANSISSLVVNSALANNNLTYTNGTSGQVNGDVAENATLTLTAPAGTYFALVNFASYGTPTGTSPNFAINPSCHATTSQSVTESYLLGNTGSVSIPATNAVFGDPCVGTGKRLKVLASYAQSICSGTSVAISGSTPTGGTGTYSYQWESSTTNATTGFAAATGTNNGINYTTGSLTQTTWFRRVVTSCSLSSTSAVVMVKVIPALPASVSIAASPTGAICAGTSVTFTATPTNGGTTPSYQWKVNGTNVGTNSATYSTTTLTNGALVVVVLTSNATPCLTGSPATSDIITMEVNPTSVGGTVSGGASVCSGSTSGLLTLTGNTGNVVRWESSVSPFSTWSPIANTGTTYTSGVLTQTTQFRAVVQSGLCATANSAPATVTIASTTWTGSSWDNGVPTSTMTAIIAANYAETANIDACTLTVSNNATVTIVSGKSVTLSGALTVEDGSSFTLNNNANLIQSGATNTNSGEISVIRNTSPLKKLDYVLWSSPVAGQNLLAFSSATLPNRFYTYNPGSDLYVSVVPSTTSFAAATGYLIRMPDTHPTSPTVWTGTFKGVPNNGDYTVPVTNGTYNAIGNPYPTTISANDFITINGIGNNPSELGDGLYFWRKTNNSLTSSYATYTTAGGIANTAGGSALAPNGTIQVGQGFIVRATSASLNFTNAMKTNNHSDQFLKTAEIERNRIWLNLTGANGIFSQTMVAYMSNATQGIDAGIDGRYLNDSPIAVTSIIENQDFAIQGRSLPFEATDIVALGFKTNVAGNYTFAIDHVDGLFTGAQDIYLRDAITGIDHDLKAGAYTFTTEAGNFANRFFVVYTAALSVENPILNANAIVIYKNDNQSFTINSGGVTMASVKVFDIRGRLLTTQNNVNINQTIITAGQANEVLLVQITSIDGATVTKKVVR